MGDEKKYSEEEAMHLVAREVAKQRMADFERKMNEGESRFMAMMSEIKVQLQNQTLLIEKQTSSFDKSIKEFRDEIDDEFNRQQDAFSKAIESIKQEIRKDFASKTDLHDLKADTEAKATAIETKVEKQWLSITVTASTIVAAALVVQYIINALNSARNLVK
jgi:HEPN domain-containing protein